MLLPLSWLADHLTFDATPEELATALVTLGHEVESIAHTVKPIANLVVGYVEGCEKHPNADKLNICTVDDGSGEKKQIICGAPNVRKGLKVAVAQIGCVLPGDFKIKKSKIRDEVSFGMICSQKELGMGEESNGIWELETKATPGTPLHEAVDGDVILDISITPNRGDALSVWGLARDLSAAGMGTLKAKPAADLPEKKNSQKNTFKAKIEDDGCPYFTGTVIAGVKNTKSPQWLKTRLDSIGLRPRNAVADITNYILHTYGQPLHAYDLKELQGGIYVRAAEGGEQLEGLDGATHKLKQNDLAIADDSGVVGLAGIVGGNATAVSDTTTDVYLEAALFNKSRVALTGQAHQIFTDARHRFERGVDPQMVTTAASEAVRLIIEICGGEATSFQEVGKLPSAPKTIAFNPHFIKSFAGFVVDPKDAKKAFQALGYDVDDRKDVWQVTPPSWALGVSHSQDLIEELLRIIGLEDVPALLPSMNMRRIEDAAPERGIEKISRRFMASTDTLEVITYSFISQKQAELFGGGDKVLRLTNPIDSDTLATMRPSLLPGLMRTAKENIARGESAIRLGEVGRIYAPEGERLMASWLWVGAPEKTWDARSLPCDPYTMKAHVLGLLEHLGHDVSRVQIRTEEKHAYHPARIGQVVLNGREVATFGELHPTIIKQMGLKSSRAVAADVDLTMINTLTANKRKFSLSPYQAVRRDFAFVVDSDVQADELLRCVKKAGGSLITATSLFDVYEGDNLPDGKKSLAVSITLQAEDKTLSEDDINHTTSSIVQSAAKRLGAELRA